MNKYLEITKLTPAEACEITRNYYKESCPIMKGIHSFTDADGNCGLGMDCSDEDEMSQEEIDYGSDDEIAENRGNSSESENEDSDDDSDDKKTRVKFKRNAEIFKIESRKTINKKNKSSAEKEKEKEVDNKKEKKDEEKDEEKGQVVDNNASKQKYDDEFQSLKQRYSTDEQKIQFYLILHIEQEILKFDSRLHKINNNKAQSPELKALKEFVTIEIIDHFFMYAAATYAHVENKEKYASHVKYMNEACNFNKEGTLEVIPRAGAACVFCTTCDSAYTLEFTPQKGTSSQYACCKTCVCVMGALYKCVHLPRLIEYSAQYYFHEEKASRTEALLNAFIEQKGNVKIWTRAAVADYMQCIDLVIRFNKVLETANKQIST